MVTVWGNKLGTSPVIWTATPEWRYVLRGASRPFVSITGHVGDVAVCMRTFPVAPDGIDRTAPAKVTVEPVGMRWPPKSNVTARKEVSVEVVTAVAVPSAAPSNS